MRVRCALLLALSLLSARCGGSDSGGVAERWAGFLADEVVAHRYSRTRDELEAFGKACDYMAPTWVRLAEAHASLERVIVVDCRHNWNGLGDSHERWNFLLRVGRSLRRAAFLWSDGCADPDGPARMAVEGVPAPVRPPGCQFDPGAYVTGLGGVAWRWDAAERRRVERAQGAQQADAELVLQFHCHQEGHRGCLHAVLRYANGSTALETRGDAGDATADAVLSFLDSLQAPWLRLETTVQGELTREAFSAFACTHGAGAAAGRAECGQSCESFANWRPKPRTWAALRPALLRMDAWQATSALTVRTGAADHIGRLPETLSKAEDEARSSGLDRPGALLEALEPLFGDCAADAPKAARDRQSSEKPCTHWRSDRDDAETPNATHALACAGAEPPAWDVATEALFDFGEGPLGTALSCAARAAAALAAAAGAPDKWGLMLFSDAPALKCVLESSAAAAAVHVAATPSAPGHIQYAPAGPVLRAAGLAAVVDWFLLGLMDTQLAVFSSAFAGAARVRAFRQHRNPPGSPQPYLTRGFERWFQQGRENHGLQGDDVATLRLLAATHDACPAERDSVRDAAAMYAGKLDRASHEPDEETGH
jgi:hypothetical protein